MKTIKITTLAFIALNAFGTMLSCKKEKPAAANKELTGSPECSFCAGEAIVLDSNGFVNEDYAQQTSFFHEDGQEVQPFAPAYRTPSGFYDYHEGMAIAFDMSQLPLACVSNKITFAHARNFTNTNDHPNLVNVKFPSTPLIVCGADELGTYLAPYGYQVQYFNQPGFVNMGMNGEGFDGVVDSLIITGPEFETVTVGANLFESELRSICIAHQ